MCIAPRRHTRHRSLVSLSARQRVCVPFDEPRTSAAPETFINQAIIPGSLCNMSKEDCIIVAR